MKQYVFTFEQGNANMRQLLGGKGANLAEMTGLRPARSARGSPLPPRPAPATTRTTRQLDEGITDAGHGGVWQGLEKLVRQGASAMPRNPLLVSVRSGARQPPCPA